MKILFYSLVCATIALFSSVQPVHAAFPSHTEATHNVSVKTEKRSFEEFINATIEKYAPQINEIEAEDGGALSISSFALGLGGLAAIIIAALTPMASGILIAAAIALGIGAIITGAKGKKRTPMRGLGIAGFVLGIVDLSILLLALLALTALVAFLLLS